MQFEVARESSAGGGGENEEDMVNEWIIEDGLKEKVVS